MYTSVAMETKKWWQNKLTKKFYNALQMQHNRKIVICFLSNTSFLGVNYLSVGLRTKETVCTWTAKYLHHSQVNANFEVLPNQPTKPVIHHIKKSIVRFINFLHYVSVRSLCILLAAALRNQYVTLLWILESYQNCKKFIMK